MNQIGHISRRGYVRASAIASVGFPLAASAAFAPPAATQGATPTVEPSNACAVTTTNIDTAAPIIVRHEIEIDAPLALVWDLHTDVDAWPTWNSTITDARLEQPLAAGASFQWSTAGLDIRSTIYALTEHARMLWGGTVQGIVGIHQWMFAETAAGVRVSTEESWSGEPVDAETASLRVALDQSIIAWLQQMKVAAEAKV